MVTNENIVFMWHSLFNLLPNVCGVLLAGLGVALIFTPEVGTRLPAYMRVCCAVALAAVGIAGLISSYIQAKADDKEKTDLSHKIDDLQSNLIL